jgi:hypothetical protein
MNTYASKMLDLLNRTGQPETQTTTSSGTSNQTVVPPKPGINIGNLMLMLMMAMDKNKNKAQDNGKSEEKPEEKYPGSDTDNPWGSNFKNPENEMTPSSVPAGMMGSVINGNSPNLTVEMLMKLLGFGKIHGI